MDIERVARIPAVEKNEVAKIGGDGHGYSPYKFLQAGVDSAPLRFTTVQKAQGADFTQIEQGWHFDAGSVQVSKIKAFRREMRYRIFARKRDFGIGGSPGV